MGEFHPLALTHPYIGEETLAERVEDLVRRVAEDSITARTRLNDILEAAGYRVETAVDGLDAFGKLQV